VLDVDRRLVDLDEQREAACGQLEQAVEPLDDVDLPQRTCQVERPRMDARRLDAELAPVAGSGQRDVAHVVLEVEVLVVDPVRIVEVERHAPQLAPQRRLLGDAALDALEDALEAQRAAGHRALVVDVHERDVGVRVQRVRIQ